MDFQENLRRIRRDQKRTQLEVAEAAGVWQTQIANYENGRGLPSMDVAIKIANFLGVGLDDLFATDAQPQPVQ